MEHNIIISAEATKACGMVLLGFTANNFTQKNRIPKMNSPAIVPNVMNTTMIANVITSRGKYYKSSISKTLSLIGQK